MSFDSNDEMEKHRENKNFSRKGNITFQYFLLKNVPTSPSLKAFKLSPNYVNKGKVPIML
jgi:hypothetical protein